MALTFSITGGADAAKFTIGSTSGVLAFKTAPNFEQPGDADANNIYVVEVGVSDGTDTTKQTISVTVTDVAEGNLPPQITSPATKTVSENSTTVMTVTATDPDAGGGGGTTPPLTGWPDASNTGAKGTLTASGAIQTNANDQVIQNLNVSGAITIRNGHSGVKIKNCRAQLIYMVDGNGNVSAGANCVVEDCTITGSGAKQMTGIQFGSANGIVRRCNISGVENGINIEAISGGTVQDNYIHSFASPGNPDPHYDGIAIQGNQSNILIEHNSINGQGLSAVVFIKTDWGPISNITVNNNKLIGGGYTCYSDQKNGAITNEKYTNNRLGGWVYGPLLANNDVEWSGNVNDSDGSPIAAASAVSEIPPDKEVSGFKRVRASASATKR